MFQEAESGSEDSSDEMDQTEDNSNPSEDLHLPTDTLPRTLTSKDKLIVKENDAAASLPSATLISSVLSSKALTTDQETLIKNDPPKPAANALNTSLPLFIPTTSNSTGTQNAVQSVSLPAGTASQIQALPLLLQTPNGMGYASTPDGMILGLLQGPNMVQPQLVALPIAPNLVQNLAKNEGKEKKS